MYNYGHGQSNCLQANRAQIADVEGVDIEDKGVLLVDRRCGEALFGGVCWLTRRSLATMRDFAQLLEK